jgi:hypothetical protein
MRSLADERRALLMNVCLVVNVLMGRCVLAAGGTFGHAARMVAPAQG